MKLFLIAFVSTLIIFVVIDFIWLRSMADVLYRPVLGDMIAPAFRPVPAVLFYLIFAAALTYFAVAPSLQMPAGIGTAVLNGAIFGFAAYATYDLTNQATLRNWSTVLTVADLAWGSFLSAVSAGAGHWVTTRFIE
jgi:uncharacterized membrane protein